MFRNPLHSIEHAILCDNLVGALYAARGIVFGKRLSLVQRDSSTWSGWFGSSGLQQEGFLQLETMLQAGSRNSNQMVSSSVRAISRARATTTRRTSCLVFKCYSNLYKKIQYMFCKIVEQSCYKNKLQAPPHLQLRYFHFIQPKTSTPPRGGTQAISAARRRRGRGVCGVCCVCYPRQTKHKRNT